LGVKILAKLYVEQFSFPIIYGKFNQLMWLEGVKKLLPELNISPLLTFSF